MLKRQNLIFLVLIFLLMNYHCFSQSIISKLNFDHKSSFRIEKVNFMTEYFNDFNLYDGNEPDELFASYSNIAMNKYFLNTPNYFSHKKSVLDLKYQISQIDKTLSDENNIEILRLDDDTKEVKNEKKTFWNSEIFYFVTAAVLATSVFLIVNNEKEPESTYKSFGKPPIPGN